MAFELNIFSADAHEMVLEVSGVATSTDYQKTQIINTIGHVLAGLIADNSIRTADKLALDEINQYFGQHR